MTRSLNAMVLALAVTFWAAAAWGALDFSLAGEHTYQVGSVAGHTIADYPDSGFAVAINFNDATVGEITDLKFTFTITGGWNGDIYAYLSHGSSLAILLNQVGADSGNPDGYGTSGFQNITLASGAVQDIHQVAAPTAAGGPYAADGRINSQDASRPNTLAAFNGVNPNGDWVLYFADLSPGSTSTLSSWSLEITAVPEPVTIALGIFSLLAFVLGVKRFLSRKFFGQIDPQAGRS